MSTKTEDILFEALHRQRLACGGYEVTGNPIVVRLAPRLAPAPCYYCAGQHGDDPCPGRKADADRFQKQGREIYPTDTP